MPRTRINIEAVFANDDGRREWNDPDIADIDFYHRGVKVEVAPEAIAEWRFIGLTNECFILGHEWPNREE